MARASRCRAVARLTTLVRAVPAFISVPWNQLREWSRCRADRMWPSFCRSSQMMSVGRCGAAAAAADPLPGAEGLDGHAVAEHDRAGPPHRSAPRRLRIVVGQQPVVQQFGLDVFQVGAGLVPRVGDDPDVRLPALQGGAQAERPACRWSIWRRRAGRARSASRPAHVAASRRVARPASGACSRAGG